MLMPSIFGEDLFDDFMRGFPFYDNRETQKPERKLYGSQGKNLIKTDIKEMEDGYVLEMDLPGFSKEQVKAELKDGYLTVTAEKGTEDNSGEKANGRYIRRERYSGACERTFYVGEDLTQQDIKGEFRHGILKLFIPKKDKQPQKNEKKYIFIEG